MPIKSFVYYLEGGHNHSVFGIKEILKKKQWEQLNSLPKGYDHSRGWFKIDAYALGITNQFVIHLPEVSKSKAFIVQNDSIKLVYEGGEFVTADKKVIKSARKDFIIPLYGINQGEFQLIIYSENFKNNSINLNWYVQKHTGWAWSNFKNTIKDAIFHSIVWIIILSSVLLYYFFDRKNYIYYSGYLFSVSLYFLWDSGYVNNFLFTNSPVFNYSLKTLQNLAPIFYWMFISRFYGGGGQFGNKRNIFYLVASLNVLVIITEFVFVLILDSYHLILSHLANMVSGASMLAISLLFLCCTWRKNKESLLVSSGVLTVAVSYLITLLAFYIGFQDFILIFKLGFLIEMFLFSLTLLFQFKVAELEKSDAKSMLIAELRKNKLIQEEYNKRLEEEVAARTEEVEFKNKEILKQRNELFDNSSELHELNAELITQAEVIQSTNERLHKNEAILKKAYQRLKETQKELELKNNAIQKINKNQEKIIASRNRGLIDAKKELDDFLYRTSHNLKGPVARIKGLLDLLKLELNGTDQVDEYLLRLSKVIKKMEIIFEKLNSISFINKIGNKEDNCNLRELVSNTVGELADIIEEQEAEVIEDTQSIIFNANPKIINIVLKYLLENSLQFKEKNRPLKIVLHVSEQDDTFVKLVVKDNGIGIKDKVIRKIFNMFYIGSLESEGDGLGLYIVKKAVDKLGGFINVESEYRKGTTFRVLLPKESIQKSRISSNRYNTLS